MKLDKRITDYHGIRCFASQNNREYHGKFGYFAENMSEFENLDNCAKGLCCFKDGENFPFYRFDITIRKPTYPKESYPLFCPGTIVNENLEVTE